MATRPRPAPIAGSAIRANPSRSACSSARCVERATQETSFQAPTACSTFRQRSFPGPVGTHSPSARSPSARASDSISSPPARRSARPTPPSMRMSQWALLTIASASTRERSPTSKVTRAP